ncbi:hypothetical protein LINPERHAP2_LOCUS39254 [Linum perenne]
MLNISLPRKEKQQAAAAAAQEERKKKVSGFSKSCSNHHQQIPQSQHNTSFSFNPHTSQLGHSLESLPWSMPLESLGQSHIYIVSTNKYPVHQSNSRTAWSWSLKLDSLPHHYKERISPHPRRLEPLAYNHR